MKPLHQARINAKEKMFDWLKRLFVNGTPAAAERKMPKGFYANSIPIDAAGEDGFQKIVPVGYFPNHPGGAHEITVKNIQEMFDNFIRSRKAAILVDYEHRSLWGDSKAAGWSSDVQARADGLYFKKPDWTPAAGEMIKNGEYRFYSPVYQLAALDLGGRQIGSKFVSAAITNIPVYEEEIDPILNNQAINEETFEMKLTPEQRALVIKNHGLAETATDEEVLNAMVNSKKTEAPKADPPKADPPAADPPDPAKANAQAPAPDAITSLTAMVTGLVETVKGLVANAKAQDEKADGAMVEGWIREFRMYPADRDTVLNSLKTDRTGTMKKYNERPIGSCRPPRVTIPAKVNASASGEPQKKTFAEKVEDLRMVVNSAAVLKN